MKLKIFIFVLILVNINTFFIKPVFAADITLDGEFGDWADKPQISDSPGDVEADKDISLVKWHLDTNRGYLYLYTERLDKNKESSRSNEDWRIDCYIKGDGDGRKLEVEYRPTGAKGKVGLKLKDKAGNELWEVKNADWGEEKDPGRRLEYYVPLEYLPGFAASGYQIEFYLQSENDRVPDSGFITISSVSTYPVSNLIAVILISILLYCLWERRRKRRFVLKR